MVASNVRERERIFLRGVENLERLLNQPVDRAAPGTALIGGALKDPEAVMVELAEYAAPVILVAVVFMLASTRPAR